MSRSSELFQPGIIEYILQHSVREPAIFARLREETAAHPRAIMQIPAEQGELLKLLVKLMGARRTIEVGLAHGKGCIQPKPYSGTSIGNALALCR